MIKLTWKFKSSAEPNPYRDWRILLLAWFLGAIILLLSGAALTLSLLRGVEKSTPGSTEVNATDPAALKKALEQVRLRSAALEKIESAPSVFADPSL